MRLKKIRYVPGTTNLVVQPINYRRAKKIIDQLAQINGKDLEFGDGVRDRISIIIKLP